MSVLFFLLPPCILKPYAYTKNALFSQVPDSVKEGLDIVYVDDVREVLKVVFADRAPDLVSRLDSLPLVPLEEVESR
jgi:hypothetical protein